MLKKITAEYIEKYQSGNGGWTKPQLKALGVDIKEPFNFSKGWKDKVIGNFITQENAIIFESKITQKEYNLKKNSEKQLNLF